MKQLLWLALLAILPVCTALAGEKQPYDHSQDGPFGMNNIPKWYMDAMVAANCYKTGMNYLTADPKLAVKAFLLGLQYAQRAEVAGGGTSAATISRAIEKELQIAQASANAHKSDKSDKSSDNAGKNDSLANTDVNNIDNNYTSDQGKYVRASTPKNNGNSIWVGGSSAHLGSLSGGGTPGQRGSM